jgi:protoporphyrinogen oxidase
MPSPQIIILGAGVSGLATAYGLRQRGVESVVLECEAEPGGLCRSVEREGFTFDHISHVLHFRSPERREWVCSLLGGRLREQERAATIYFRGRYVPYPFQGHLGFLPLGPRLDCVFGMLLAGRRDPSDARNFEEWIDSSFGPGVARHFMVPYNRKLWGAPLREISTDWLGFVPPASPKAVLRSLAGRKTTAGYNATFFYPDAGGMGALVRALAKGSDVRCNATVAAIDLAGRTVRLAGGQGLPYTHLVSSLPLNLLASMSQAPPSQQEDAAGLRAVGVASITFALRCPLPHRHHWTYFADAEFPFFRLFFPSNVQPASVPAGCSTVTAEIATLDGAEPDVAATVRALVRLGYVRGEQDVLFTHRARYAYGYPLHDLGRAGRAARLLEYFAAHGVTSIGRFGMWQYSSVEDALRWGEEAAERVAAGAALKAEARS